MSWVRWFWQEARRAASRAALHRRQEQGHEHADDRDHDQQFDEGEGRAVEVRMG